MYSNFIKTLIYILSLGLLGFSSQCNKRLDCANTIYGFNIGIKAYPDKDSVQVGDTLWLEITEPVILQDTHTGNMINYADAANLGTAISFAKLISTNSTDDQVAGKFKYFLVEGSEVQRQDFAKYREYNFSETNGNYKFKLGLIPREMGVFKMFVSNAANVFRKSDHCTKAYFEIDFKETNQHFYFNEVSFPGIILSGKNGVYLFKVH